MNKAQAELMDFLSEKSLEQSNFEGDYMSLENAENIVRANYGINAARQFRKRISSGLTQGKPMLPSPRVVGTIDRGSKLSFTIVVERVDADLNLSLPAFIFGVNDRFSGFSAVGQLPSGITLQSATYGIDQGKNSSERLDLTFTNGTLTDTVRITCQNNPYPVLLEATKTDLLLMQGVRLSLSDATQVSQFDNQIRVVKNSIAGNSKVDNLTPTSYKNPEQFQSGIVDIPEGISIDKNTTLQMNILPIAGFKVSMNFYAGSVKKWDSSDLTGM